MYRSGEHYGYGINLEPKPVAGDWNGSGGGILIENSNPLIANAMITDNTGNGGGGICLINQGNPLIVNTTISGRRRPKSQKIHGLKSNA